jgi:endonuclease/exonuclease/phosphatase (EEP) superfamily protein YafD
MRPLGLSHERKKVANLSMPFFLKALIIAGLALGAMLTLLGFLAGYWPALDIVNDGLPLLLAGAVLLLCLALIVRDRRLILFAALLAAINVGGLFVGLGGGAPEARPGSARFLRVVTFNLWSRNDRMQDVATFLAEADADVVVLQEATRPHWAELRPALAPRYPNSVGDRGLVILSKHPILADGRIDRPGYPEWNSLMVRWVRLDVNGTGIEIAGAHLTRPYYAALQTEDIGALTKFVKSTAGPLIVAGDFNMTPWTYSLRRFTQATGLKRYNTFHLTWPMRWRNLRLLPLVAIDHVFASSQFAAIATRPGPRLGSDHRLIIADIALASPSPASVK